MPHVQANGISIYYEQRGSGPSVLFFNGSGATLATAGFLVDVFAQQCSVLAHDQRGLGATEIPDGPYSMADYAHDAAALLDALGIDRIAIAGISFGGMVAQEFAVQYPQRVTRLALACTSPGGAGGASYPLHELADLTEAERGMLAIQLMDTRFDPEWLAVHPADQFLVESMAKQGSREKTGATLRGEFEQLQARRHHDVYERLPTVTASTLVTAGRFDAIAPLSNAEAIVRQIPQAQLKVYEGGHAFFAQDRNAFPDLLAFLSESG